MNPLPAAFLDRVYQEPEPGCWRWLGPLDRDGYGHVSSKGRMVPAHHYAYEHALGPYPDGLCSDHLCRNRDCVNPAHIEPVTRRVNTLRGTSPPAINARKTHCPAGHPYDDDHTYRDARGTRHCRPCNSAAVARYQARKRGPQ